MIKSIGCQNYKAFANAKLELKPITILLGANSSGKSSLLQLILMLEQTINITEKYQSALKLNGHYVGMGEPSNLFMDGVLDNPLEISFDIDAKSYIENYKKRYSELEQKVFLILLSFFLEEKSNNNTTFEIWCKRHGLRLKDHLFSTLKRDSMSKDIVKFYLERKDPQGVRKVINVDDLIKQYKDIDSNNSALIQKISRLKGEVITVQYRIRLTNNRLETYLSSLIYQGERILEYQYTKEGNERTTSDMFSVGVLDLKSTIFFRCLEPVYDIEPDNYQLLVEYEFLLLSAGYAEIRQSFKTDKISYISPLRAYPQRYYLLDESNDSSRLFSNRGTSLAEILKKKQEVNDSVNSWLDKFGLSVSVKEYKDIINNIKISQNGNSLDITDVGFGISQVLPIIVQCYLSQEETLTIIEQPEIHLHPKIQAELTDLFIDTAGIKKNGKNRFFLIETHSEYLIKRLRRRIADGGIKANDVAIYFVEPRDGKDPNGAKLKRIEISKYGEIEWPKDYYSTQIDDDLKYIKAIINNR